MTKIYGKRCEKCRIYKAEKHFRLSKNSDNFGFFCNDCYRLKLMKDRFSASILKDKKTTIIKNEETEQFVDDPKAVKECELDTCREKSNFVGMTRTESFS